MNATEREKARKKILDGANTAITLAIALAWALPMLVFWYRAWDTRRPLITAAYLLISAMSLAAAFCPDTYFRPKAFELSGHAYEAVGIRCFRRYMVNGDRMNSLIRKSVPDYRFIDGREAMRRFEAQTRVSERGHLLWLFSGIPPTAYAFLSGRDWFALYFLLANLVLNVYPIMLQRYNRIRILRILQGPPRRVIT